jgi:hypothetical protein
VTKTDKTRSQQRIDDAGYIGEIDDILGQSAVII